jgi:nitrous oxide reductase accessory protein NosL
VHINKILKFFILIVLFSLYVDAQDFTKKAISKPILVQDSNSKKWCPVCGNDLIKVYKTNYTANLKNGTKRQYCSMRCLVEDIENYGIDQNSIKVIDVKNEKFIDAHKAFYVVGSKIIGTMSKKSKLAFSTSQEAKNFIKKYKGKIVDFKKAVKLAQNALKADKRMYKKLKRKNLYAIGKKIFNKVCKKELIDIEDYLEINELKAAIVYEKLCKPLNYKQLHALAVYLWDKDSISISSKDQQVQVSIDEKCPVSGMFTYKYPRWAAQIFFKHDDHEHHYSFDGVKDMMKFYFNPMLWGDYKYVTKQNITKILVTDYYSQKAIDATKAFYVIGSDIYGPMGNELIPFENIDDAKTFKNDHRGVKIIQFENIIEDEVYKLDDGQ